MKILLIAAIVSLVAPAFAQQPPVPKMFKGMDGRKGQYQVEMLEGGGRPGGAKAPPMTICTDNLMKPPAGKGAPRESGCKHRLLKDTADEAVIESVCDGRTSTVTMKRESARSLLMTMESSGAKGPQTTKMRYTHIGACREGQGAVSLDPNGEQCKKLKAQAAQMDPKMREQILAMCR
jgi:hypothetical protein